MEGALLALLTPAVLVFGVVVWMITLLFRKIVEGLATKIAYVFPDKYEPWWQEGWRDWALPATPVVIGALAAYLFPTYPFPEMFSESLEGRVFLGMVLGGASGYVYRWAKVQFKKYVPEKMQELEEKLSSDDDDDNK